VAQRLSDSLGQQFFVENIGGAGGNTRRSGRERRSDGYTIMGNQHGFSGDPSLYPVPYDPIKDSLP